MGIEAPNDAIVRFENPRRILAPYLENEENLFVISSDFCHWGSRYRQCESNAASARFFAVGHVPMH